MAERLPTSCDEHPPGTNPGRAGHPGELFSDATGRLFDEYDGVIRSALAGRPLQEADREDCRQEVWREVLATRLGKFRGGDLRAWLAAVARNKAADAVRRACRHPVVDAAAADVACAGSSAASRADDARALVWETLAALESRVHPLSFLVFFLRGIEGWSFAEIGEVLGFTPSQARLRQHRVKQKFRELADLPPPDPTPAPIGRRGGDDLTGARSGPGPRAVRRGYPDGRTPWAGHATLVRKGRSRSEVPDDPARRAGSGLRRGAA